MGGRWGCCDCGLRGGDPNITQGHIRTPQAVPGSPSHGVMKGDDTAWHPKSSNDHPRPCSSVPLPKEAELPPE